MRVVIERMAPHCFAFVLVPGLSLQCCTALEAPAGVGILFCSGARSRSSIVQAETKDALCCEAGRKLSSEAERLGRVVQHVVEDVDLMSVLLESQCMMMIILIAKQQTVKVLGCNIAGNILVPSNDRTL